MEIVALTRAELEALPDYSMTIPTGRTVGKRWRRDMNAMRPPVITRLDFWNGTPVLEAAEPEWWMGEYVRHEDPELVGIRWCMIVLEPEPVPAALRPKISSLS